MRTIIAILTLLLVLVVPAFAQTLGFDPSKYEVVDRGSKQCDRNIYDVAVLQFKDLPDSIAPDAYLFSLDGQPYALLMLEWGPDREDPDSPPIHAYFYMNGKSQNADKLLHETQSICDLLEPAASL